MNPAQDPIVKAIGIAIESYGREGDNQFNSAGFGRAIYALSGCMGALDGRVVRTLLKDRPDIVVLSGGSHFRWIPPAPSPAPRKVNVWEHLRCR